jgi:hypothetical protein
LVKEELVGLVTQNCKQRTTQTRATTETRATIETTAVMRAKKSERMRGVRMAWTKSAVPSWW